ncbi:MAG TPA: ATP-binding protein [Anaerolineales bacterium]|nr:ATP-binding protein [Anaerolineales bacterium]
MKKPRASFLRGLTVQLLSITVLPLTLLLLLIAFGSVSLHQQDMRALVGERDERAVQSAAAALDSELHHLAANISNLAALAEFSENNSSISTTDDLASDFDGGLAYLDKDGRVITSTLPSGLWSWIAQNNNSLALSTDASTTLSTKPEPVFSTPYLDPSSNRYFIIVSQVVPSRNIIVAGAFSPETLARETLSASYPDSSHVTIFLLDPSRTILFSSGPLAAKSISLDHPGVAEALRGESGTTYLKQDGIEHVVAYSFITPVNWALITEEEWEMVTSPSLQITQLAPLVLVPAFILALVALWFVATRIVRPLQKLETKAAALAWGDFDAIKDSVGGISEVQHLQKELTEMSRKVQTAQEGLRDYISAITSAQEEERLRLARELHDDTIQSVIALKQRVQLAQQSVKDQPTRRVLSELETLSEQTIENLRRMTRALRPIYLEDLGLVTALEMLTGETNQNHAVNIKFQKFGEEQRLSHEVELALYRIAQEALNNVVRHSQAKNADLLISFGEKETRLEVRDNGIGFDMPRSPTDFASNGHFGLLGIRERADLIGARLEVESVPGKGTRLKIRL